jgi:hypothetical protein
MQEVNTSSVTSPILPVSDESSDLQKELENKASLELSVFFDREDAAASAANLRLRRAMLAGVELFGDVARLACSLRAISLDFAVYNDILHRLRAGERPVEKASGEWKPSDVSKSLVWGLAKRGHGWFPPVFASLLRRFESNGDVSVMPLLADVLEEAGVDEPDLLSVLREPRVPYFPRENAT